MRTMWVSYFASWWVPDHGYRIAHGFNVHKDWVADSDLARHPPCRLWSLRVVLTMGGQE